MTEATLRDRFGFWTRRLAGNSTLRGVILIGGGAAAGQIITVAATPIVSRLYGPPAYGALAVFTSILNMASILVTFRYEVAIPLPTEDEEARDLLVLALAMALVAAGLVCAGLLGWLAFARPSQPNPLLRHLVWTLPLGMLGAGGYQSFAYWATRKRLYRPISATRLNQSVAAVGSQILLFRLPPQGLGLILAAIVARAFGLRTLITAFWASSPKTPWPSPARLVALLRKYWSISAYGIATAVATEIGDSLPSLLLARAFGLPAAGIYLMASRIFALPSQMVGAAVSQVFMGECSHRLREDPRTVHDYFHSVHRNLRWVGGGVLLLGALSPLFLPWVLGAKWHAAGMVAAILAPMAATDITVRPLYNITVIANRPRLQLVTGLVPMAFSVLGLGLPIFLGGSDTTALVSYSLSRCLGSGVIYLIYRSVARNLGSGEEGPGPGPLLPPLDTGGGMEP